MVAEASRLLAPWTAVQLSLPWPSPIRIVERLRRPRPQRPKPPPMAGVPALWVLLTRKPEPRRYRPSTDRPATLDLGARWEDVRRIAKSHPAYRWCLQAGWESEDLVSEVMVRVLARQTMGSRYDPERAGVAKYLWTLTGSIMRNLAVSVRHLGSSEEGLVEEGTMDDAPDPDGLEWVETIEW